MKKFVVVLLLLSSPPTYAITLSENLWSDGVTKLWQLTQNKIGLNGLIVAQPKITSLDMAALEKQFSAVEEQSKWVTSPSPSLGAFFGEGAQSTTVISLYVGGPLDRARVQPGDIVTSANGQPMKSYTDIENFAKHGAVTLTIAGHASAITVQDEIPHLYPAETLKAITDELKSIRQGIDNLKPQAENISSRGQFDELNAQYHNLSQRLADLKEKITRTATTAASDPKIIRSK